MLANFPFIAVGIIAIAGIVTMLLRVNIIRIIMGLTLLEAAGNFLLVAIGYRHNSIAPIFTSAPEEKIRPPAEMVLPTVQAMTLTSIVIGVATLALLLSFVMAIYRDYGTLDCRSIRKLQG